MPAAPRRAPAGDDRFAAGLRGFGPVGLLAIVVILAGNLLFLPLSALLALAWARASRTPLADLGFSAPKSWLRDAGAGVALGAALKLTMKAVVMPLLGAPAINPVYHYLAGNSAALPWVLYAVIFGAGFGEETIFRGYAFERLGRLLGSSRVARAAIVLLTTALFALAHYPDQGLFGVEQAAFTGLVFGAVYAATG